MIADYLQRGIFSGIVAGLAYGLYMVYVGNPFSQYLHDAGHDHDHDHGHGDDHSHGHGDDHNHGTGDDHGHAHGDDHGAVDHVQGHDHGHAVSETTNFIVSAGSGILWAILLGGIFAIALYFLEPALPGRDGVKSYVLAGAGFLSVSAVPWLVLPPATPGAENTLGIDARLGIYVALVALGIVVSAIAITAFRRLSSRHLGFGLLGGALPIVAVVIVLPLATPTIVSHPELSSEIVTVYQALAAFSQAGIWLLIAASFNWFQRRAGMFESTTSREELLASP